MSESFHRRPSFLAMALAATIAPILTRQAVSLAVKPLIPQGPGRQRNYRFRSRERAPNGAGLNRRCGRATGPLAYDAWKLSLWAERRAKREQLGAQA